MLRLTARVITRAGAQSTALRAFSSQATRGMATGKYEEAAWEGNFESPVKIKAPPMVYISGEEMTEYGMQLIVDKWVKPHVDISSWEFYDLSCKARDDTEDQVLHDAVDAGRRLKAIFKEPTITPTAVQKEKLGLKKSWGSPNGAMRRGWNGITISRDTIHIEGIELGYKSPVLFDRHPLGGEYGAGWKAVGQGRVMTTFFPDDQSESPVIIDSRICADKENVVVVYDNPLDNVTDLAHHFFGRCLEAEITPYVVTKKTVFKWQEGFWRIMKEVFDEHYKEKYLAKGLLDKCGGELPHLISDAATMSIIRWVSGGFGMAAHNYDGDMLTDEISQIHRSPGFITSNLIGKDDNGVMIKEFEASHGTVADLWEAHLRGEETSLNPLGMVEALIGAMEHSAHLAGGDVEKQMKTYTKTMRKAVHNTFRYGQGTRDMAGPEGLNTEDFIDKVGWRLGRYLAKRLDRDEGVEFQAPFAPAPVKTNVDEEAVKEMFAEYDKDGDGTINIREFQEMLVKMAMAPVKGGEKGRVRSSASIDSTREHATFPKEK